MVPSSVAARLRRVGAHLAARRWHASAAASARLPTLLLHDPACALHSAGIGHPERPDRFHSCLEALEAAYADEGEGVRWVSEAPPATKEQISRVHTDVYAETLRTVLERAVDEDRAFALDGDTVAGPGTRDAVLRAAGGVCAAVDAVLGAEEGAGAAMNAFCLVRPPGHHAEPDRAMGFCPPPSPLPTYRHLPAEVAHWRLQVSSTT